MSDFEFSKKTNRQLSDFFADEFLYEYLTDDLDSERKKIFEQKILNSPDLQKKVREMREYVELLSSFNQIEISSELAARIQEPSTYWWVLLMKMRVHQWPYSYRMALEGITVGILAVLMIMIIPWNHVLDFKNRMTDGAIQLAEITRTQYSNPDPVLVAQDPSNEQNPLVFEDEQSKNSEMAASAPSPKVVLPIKNATQETVDSKSTKRQGFLFRGQISVTNAEAISKKLVEFLVQNGGRKAGEVELGWKKGDGYYFHFTIPEANQKLVEDYFKSFGVLKINKEPHPRLMPDGIMRLIITVEEKK